MTRLTPRIALLSLGLLAACDTNSDPVTAKQAPPVVYGQSLAALTEAESCDDVLAQLKTKTQTDATKAIADNLAIAKEWSKNGCMMWEYDGTGPNAGGGTGGATQASSTNTQVAGVDEADFVKNDNQFIYAVANGKLQILKAWPAAEMTRIAQVPVEGTPKKLYVANDRALVYSALGPVATGASYTPYGAWGGMSYPGNTGTECTYGYDCDFTGDGQVLKITVFDITDRTQPKVLRETTFSGSYLNSRRIGNMVHTVVVFPEVSVPGLSFWPTQLADPWQWCGDQTKFPYSDAELEAMFATLAAKNHTLIGDSTIAQYLPGIKDLRHTAGGVVEESGLLAGCKGFYLSQEGDGKSLISLVSMAIDDLGTIGATTVVGKTGAVFASQDALYIAVRHQADQMGGWYYEENSGIQEATTVHKFKFGTGTQTSYVGSGAVKGRILNQFSMDELNGVLRIATTTGHLPSPDVYSTLATMAPVQIPDGPVQLGVLGMVDKIAPAEDIRSVRFDGDVGYVVTFKKTDPLFVFDLKDPKAPKLVGELKIPGFSTYMHLLDEHHLLTIGYDADDQGSFAWFTGIRLQVIDVTDYNSPKIDFAEVIGTRGSTSDAATNHLAFTYFAPKHWLGLPITVCEDSAGGGSYGSTMSFSGLFVYDVTSGAGFQKLGGLASMPPQTTTQSGACGNWWTQSNSWVKRSVFMDDFVYAISADAVISAAVADLNQPLAKVDLLK
ncbi:MAG: beta-propeller domain-containing protein [Myxococcota bacterium]